MDKYSGFISWDGDILQSVGTLLGFFDIGGKPDSCVFDHGKLNGQLFHTFESCLGLVQGQLGAVVGVGRRIAALKNITIPRYETLTRDITNALEEKEREEFTRLKVIKRMKQGG